MHVKIPLSPISILIFIGAVGTVAGVGVDGRVDANDIRALGLGLVFVGLGWLAVKHTTRPMSAVYELGHQEGRAIGYEEGRKVAKPVLLTGKRCCGNCQRGSASNGNVAALGARAAILSDTAVPATQNITRPIDSRGCGDGNG